MSSPRETGGIIIKDFVVTVTIRSESSPWQQLKNRIYLGDDDVVNNMHCKIDHEQSHKDINTYMYLLNVVTALLSYLSPKEQKR